MKNPLNKRLPREFRKDFGKYLVIFLLLVITIGFVSGFLVADGSMIKAYNEGIDKYNTENGHFRTSEKMNDAQIQSVEENRIRIYDNFYLEQDLTNGSTMRIFANRDQVNLACLMEGEFPKAANEIAIDRMYADNNKISVGDTLKSDTQSWKVTGLIALPDYSCLFQNNNDSMFDSVKFGIGVVTSEAFESLDSPLVKYCYAWKYNDEPTTEKEEKEVSDDLMKAINKEVSLEEFVPRYLNQAITFTRDDMGSDRAMMIVFLYIVIAIMAFVFGITISNTIAKESNVIGTLLASGYTRNEPPLYGHANPCHANWCFDWKHSRLYDHERYLRRHVLRKLQSSNICDRLERRSISAYYDHSDLANASRQLHGTSQKIITFSFEVPPQRLKKKTTEAYIITE